MVARFMGRAYDRGVKLTVTISPKSSAMLDRLLAAGLFGIDGRAGVARELIYRSLRSDEVSPFWGATGPLKLVPRRRRG